MSVEGVKSASIICKYNLSFRSKTRDTRILCRATRSRESQCDFTHKQSGKSGKSHGGSRFSLHAGVAVRARERKKLEHLCRYIARPAVSAERLSLTRNGRLRYELKTPWRDGTTHILFEPLDFIARLVALVPKPRVNLTRFHGVFAPKSKHRALVTPAQRGMGRKAHPHKQGEEKTPFEHRVSMTRAQRLKRVFEIEIETCCETAARW